MDRTLVYVEGDARLDNYQGDDGKTHQTLRLTQRKNPPPKPETKSITHKINTYLHNHRQHHSP